MKRSTFASIAIVFGILGAYQIFFSPLRASTESIREKFLHDIPIGSDSSSVLRAIAARHYEVFDRYSETNMGPDNSARKRLTGLSVHLGTYRSFFLPVDVMVRIGFDSTGSMNQASVYKIAEGP